MSNETPKSSKLTVDAPIASKDGTVQIDETTLPSFMMSQANFSTDMNASIEDTAASMAHVAPYAASPVEESTVTPEQPLVQPEVADRSQPVFTQPAFDAHASLEAAAAEEAPVFPDVAEVGPIVEPAPTASPEMVAPAAAAAPMVEAETFVQVAPQPVQKIYVEPTPVAEPKPMVTDFTRTANEPVSHKYAFAGIAAAITILSVGLFVLPYDDKPSDDTQTIAMLEQPSAAAAEADIQVDDTAATAEIVAVAAVEEPVAELANVDLSNQELAESTSGALSELGVIINQRSSSTPTLSFVDEAALSGNTLVPLMRDVTQQIITDADVVAPTQQAPQSQQEDDLATMIAQAISSDQSNAVLRAIITDAIQNNQMTVPRALVNSNGDIDTASLVAALVQFSAEGSAVDPGYELPPQRTFDNGDTLEHLVVQGESLASISLRYYGNTFDYPRIFAANTDKLASPDKIRIGQRLVIPQ